MCKNVHKLLCLRFLSHYTIQSLCFFNLFSNFILFKILILFWCLWFFLSVLFLLNNYLFLFLVDVTFVQSPFTTFQCREVRQQCTVWKESFISPYAKLVQTVKKGNKCQTRYPANNGCRGRRINKVFNNLMNY